MRCGGGAAIHPGVGTDMQKTLDSGPYPAYSRSADGTLCVHLVYYRCG